MVKMDMLTLDILHYQTLKNTTPWANVQQWEILGSIANHYPGQKRVVNFLFYPSIC